MAKGLLRGPAQLRTFSVVWAGQLISLVGSGLTRFALGVWVFERTGSVTQFSLILLAASLPGIVASPLAGALVDRWDRRRVMIASDTGTALATLAVAVLLSHGSLDLWHIYVASAVMSLLSAFQVPAYTASVTLLVPPEHLVRASGMMQLGFAAGQVLSPLLAGVLMAIVGLHGVILIDVATFFVGVAALLMVRFPGPPSAPAGAAPERHLGREIAEGWSFISSREGLLTLLVLYAGINICTASVNALMTPMILGFTTPQGLGLVVGLGSAGMLAGSVAMIAWGGPRRRVPGILAFAGLLGISLALVGARPSIVLVTVAYFFATFSLPILNGCDQVLWQLKTPPEMQGRVFSTRLMVAWLTLPLAYATAGPLADRVFGPLLENGGAWASGIGMLVGTGPGRGTALLVSFFGLLLAAMAAVAATLPSLRRLDSAVPDWVPPAAPVPAADVLETDAAPRPSPA